MKIWLQYEGGDAKILRAVAGGVRGGVFIDGTEVGSEESVIMMVAGIEQQGFIPVVRVKAASGVKRLQGGLAIIYGDFPIKNRVDNKTLQIKRDGTKQEQDNAIKEALSFLKKNRVPSPLT
jgi:hypothetical protein